MDVSYIVPLRRTIVDEREFAEFGRYLAGLAADDILLVDGSPVDVFDSHAAFVPSRVRHLRVNSNLRLLNGKVAGVMTGLHAARFDAVIIADDDVRYDAPSLTRMRSLLAHADVVRPQNYFETLPWHALLDTARTLVNRALDGDWPGTLGVRRSIVLGAGGYDGNVLFENLEMVRTVRAAGGHEKIVRDLFVRRLPPTTKHFLRQRVRQAYDEFARPIRLAITLAILPSIIVLLVVGRRRDLLALSVATMLAAEYGRRRGGGVRVFPFFATLLAPAWVAERALCAWVAVALRLCRGGVAYSNGRIRQAATPMNALRKRLA